MHPEELALRKAICAEPADDTPRLVYADWLDENAGATVVCDSCGGTGHPRPSLKDMPAVRQEPGPGGRLMNVVDLPPVEIRIRKCEKCGGGGVVPDPTAVGRRERAEFIRVQVELARLPTDNRARELESRVCVVWESGVWRTVAAGLPGEAPVPLKREAGIGLAAILNRTDPIFYRPSRGFVSRISLPAREWLTHADALVWRPVSREACGKCKGAGVVEQTARTPERDLIWFGDRALYGWFDCPECSRPFPATAQPIERVTLTGDLNAADFPPALYRPDDDTYRFDRWPGIVFELRLDSLTVPEGDYELGSLPPA